MLRIIEGKRYNTRTATDVLALHCRYYSSDFKWEDTELYVTKKGNWFLAGHGNAASRWARRCGDMWGPGDGIAPITADEAQEILEQHDQVELIEEYFGDSLEDA